MEELKDFSADTSVVKTLSSNALETNEVHVADVEQLADFHLERDVALRIGLGILGLETPRVVHLGSERHSLQGQHSFDLVQDMLWCFGRASRSCKGRSDGSRGLLNCC